MDLGYRNRRCLVTASTGGLGFAIARAMAGEGATVVVNGRGRETVDKAIARIRAEFPDAQLEGAVGNSGTREGCETLIENCPDVDVLVANLGIYEAVDIYKAGDDRWYELIEVNVMSGVRLARHYLPKMLARDSGRVIFMASESGINPAPEMPAYSATKTMQLSLARNLAETTKGTNVTVNSVLPGPCSTEGVAALIAGLYPDLPKEEAERRFVSDNRPTSLIQRLSKPQEVADFVTFLGSVRTGIVNGAALRIDGGLIRTVM
ncbi:MULTISPECIES: SDR family oxidoreductase [unclassified Rhizobium]|uniref:SDR family NAD(P)-dependent oxidoreductase n=1 Tax=unclassified Rhizobium TaxID=2613769 RepID=UPI00040458CC|nr:MULTISPECIES: SDR family oxidoreductase [unclassified Rhizobium]MBD9454970.1 SDR family oxidoreductase [Rhizobium sp. RHZ02]NMN71539.1 3-oxoacyl-[acyl-carrier protein] reductase [Rhizobium sp. 57MFTsu3.2]